MKSVFLDETITRENYKNLCYTSHNIIKGEIKGVVTDFHGFGQMSMKNGEDKHDKYLAEKGILVVFPFYGPFAWANDGCMEFCEKIIDLTYEIYNIPETVPFVINGESMGGMTAINFAAYTKRKAVAVSLNSPVCDLKTLTESRIDILRALCDAYAYEGRGYEDAMKAHSPIEMVDRMPKVPFYFVQGGEDLEFPGEQHSGVMTELMKAKGYDVRYEFVPEMEHCHIPKGAYERYFDFIIEQIEKNQ